MTEILVGLVQASRRRPVTVVAVALVLTLAIGAYTVRHISIDTDTNKMISPKLQWRVHAAEVAKDFPQNDDLLAVVIDAATPDQASDAAHRLTEGLLARPDLFREVRQPDAAMFFRTNGLLFLSPEEVQKFADSMIAAQPLLGTVAADPSLRGVFDAVDLLAQGALRGAIPAAMLNGAFEGVAKASRASAAGRVDPLSWQNLLSGRAPMPRELRHIVLCQPVLDYGAVQPGKRAAEAIRDIARRRGLDAAHGVRVRITGDTAIGDDQLSALSEGAGWTAVISVGFICFWLLLALRSVPAAAAILITLLGGLVWCAGFATAALGPLNPISLAFAPLFIGIAIDFGIQLSVRYLAERETAGSTAEAIQRAARGVSVPLAVAALATAAGFLSFVPTDYAGVSSLGLIAGVGMLVALLLNLTLLPALLELFQPRGRHEANGFPGADALDRLIARRRPWVLGAAAALALACAAFIPRVQFDFNPIHLQNPRSESVATLFDLMASSDTTPYTIKVLVPTEEAAVALAKRLSQLPEVSQVISLASFVPADQEPKLAIMEDTRSLLAPTIEVAATSAPPTAGQVLASIRKCAADVGVLAARGDPASHQLADALAAVLAAPDRSLPLLQTNLGDGLQGRLADLRLALQAGPVAVASIPEEVRRDWVGRDGRFVVEAFPRGDARDNAVLRRFSAAVLAVAPDGTGTPVAIQESARTVTHAFATAGVLAVASIVLLLALVLRRPAAIVMVLLPLLLAGLLTLAAGTLAGMALNFANIITLPLLLGIGVAFDIYLVVPWLAGDGCRLHSSTARGVLFSALTTGTAFGSLAFSKSPGMSEMGKLLSLALFFTLVCTLLLLPALLSKPSAHRNDIRS